MNFISPTLPQVPYLAKSSAGSQLDDSAVSISTQVIKSGNWGHRNGPESSPWGDIMRRRDFVKAMGALPAVWPLAARAQQTERMRRIGVLMPFHTDNPEAQTGLAAFQQGLQQLGWTEGGNLQVEYRWSGGDAERIKTCAAELAALVPDVILASSGAVVGPLRRATRTVPIVFTETSDPVGAGFVESLPRPGGNVTGFLSFEYGMVGNGWNCSSRLHRASRGWRSFAMPPFPPGPANGAHSSQWRRRSGLSCVRSMCMTPARSSALSRHSRVRQTAA